MVLQQVVTKSTIRNTCSTMLKNNFFTKKFITYFP